MGLFGNYTKVGPGVSKDEDEERSAFQMFFIRFKRRLSKFAILNLTFMIPTAVIAIIMAFLYFYTGTRYNISVVVDEVVLAEFSLWDRYVFTLPLILLSPFWGGMMVVARRLSQGEYSFVWSEYWEGVRDNFGQFLANGIVLYILYTLLSFSFTYYLAYASVNMLYYIPVGLITFAIALLLLAQIYVSLIIVSIELPLMQIYKNSLIFAVLGIKKNFFYILTLAVLALISLLHILVLILFPAIIACSMIAYANSYICYPVLKKYIIDPYNNPQSEDDQKLKLPEQKEEKIWDFDEEEQVFEDA